MSTQYRELQNMSISIWIVMNWTIVIEYVSNSHFNSDYLEGKIYKITLEKCDKVYIGSTCEELETRLKWHVSNNTSQAFKNKRYNHKIELVVKAGNYLKEWRISGYTNMLQNMAIDCSTSKPIHWRKRRSNSKSVWKLKNGYMRD